MYSSACTMRMARSGCGVGASEGGTRTEAVRRLKADERTARIPVVALTALAMTGDRERFLEDGFDDYLEKPISVRDFGDQIRSRLR